MIIISIYGELSMYATLLSTMITASHTLYYMEARILLD